MREFRYALRALRSHPRLTIGAAAVLTLGIGASTAVFSAVYGILLKPLPYAEPERLVVALHDGTSPVSPADYLDYKAQAAGVMDMAAAQAWSGLLRRGDKLQTLRGMQITADMIPLLGVQPALGRAFEPGEEDALLLSDEVWRREFGGDVKVLNTLIDIGGKPFRIAGVMPRSFRFAPFWQTDVEMWSPLSFRSRANDRAGRSLRLFARLKSGVSRARAQSAMSGIAARLEAAHPDTNAGLTIQIIPLREKAAGPVRGTLLLLMGTVMAVLAIACADIGNLLLARAVGRQREMATRSALGASALQLARQLVAESLTISLAGGAGGLLLAKGALGLLRAWVPEAGLPREEEIGMSWPVMCFALAVSLATGLAASLAPLWQSGRVNIAESLKEAGRGASAGRGARRLQNALIGAQVALAMVLLVCAALLTGSLRKLNAVEAGFDVKNVLTLEAATAKPDPAAMAETERRLRALPGVEQVSAINHLPIGGDVWTLNYTVYGRPAPAPGHEFGAIYRVVRPGYFQTLRIALEGRDFDSHDDANAPAAVIVNRTFAGHQWPGENAIGKRIVFEGRVLTVMGISNDVRQSDWTSPIEDEMYLPYLQRGSGLGMNSLTFVVRTRGASERLVARLQAPVAISRVRSLESVASQKLWRERIAAWLLSGFAGIALLLAAAGIYGVIAYSVQLRTRELGIRMALGATGRGILALMAKESAWPIGAGLAAGCAGAAGAMRALAAQFYGVSPSAWPVVAAVASMLALTCAAAVALPLRSLRPLRGGG